MSAPMSSAAGQQREVDRQLQQPGTSSSQSPTMASLPPRPQAPQLPQNPQHTQHPQQEQRQRQPPLSSPSRSQVRPPPHSASKTANSSILPPLSDGRRASISFASKISPKFSFRTPAAPAIPSPRQPLVSTDSAALPAPAQNGYANRSSQPSPASPAGGASSSRTPSVVAQPTTASQTAPMAAVTMSQTPVPVPVPGEVPKPRPTYKMKRTGKPGMPPGIPLNISVSATSSPSISPSMTPPPARFGQYAQGKIRPPKPTVSASYSDNPLPTAITSDIAPGSSTSNRPGINGTGKGNMLPQVGASTYPTAAPQSRAGDKRRKSTSPGVLQGRSDASSKRARLEASAEIISSDSDDDGVDSDVDSDDDSGGQESEDAADGEVSDDSSDEDDEDDEDGVGIEDEENSPSPMRPYLVKAARGPEPASDDFSSDEEGFVRTVIPAVTPAVNPVAKPSQIASNKSRKTKKNAMKEKKLGRPLRSLNKPKSVINGAIPIFRAPSGRLYNIWINKNGVGESTSGAIIPDGYKLHTDPKFSWVCPVRSCRVTFSQLSGLGHHFSRGHRSQHLNDNLDGTLTVIKQWESNQSIGARVVSQKKLADPGPLLQPRLKGDKKPAAASTLPGVKLNQKESQYISLEQPTAANDGYLSSSSDSSSADSMPPLMDMFTPKANLPPQAQSAELLASASGRAYSKTIDGNLSHGVSFPDGYKLSSYPAHPWVCPVRSCRRVLKAIHNLGGHYSRQHRDCLLNENNDGTHSIVGHYKGRRPLVVSHHRIPITELEPLAEEIPAGAIRPITPSTAKQQDANESLVEDHSTILAGDDTPMANTGTLIPGRHPAQPQHEDLPTPMPADGKALWRYIEPVLKRTSSQAVLKKSYMHLFLDLPRKREIHWNAPWIAQNPYLDSQPRDIASLVVQLTGDYAEVPCNHCKLGKGPYSGCIIVSSNAGPGLAASFESCANCLYHCGQTYCSIKNIFKPRFEKLFPDMDFEATRRYVRSGVFSKDLAKGGIPEADRSLKTFASKGGVDAAVLAAREDDKRHHRKHRFPLPHKHGNRHQPTNTKLAVSAAERQLEMEARAELKRRSDRIAFKDITDSATPPVQQQSTTAVPVPHHPEYRIDNNNSNDSRDARATANANEAKLDSSIIFAGAAQMGPEMLEMEDWEIAPGRITTGTRTIAYSGAYLTSSQVTHWNHDVSLRVQIVKPGATMTFESEATSYRTCIISSGKLRVTVGGKKMTVGPNGAFEVLSGEEFSVANHLYIDATMFVSSYYR